MKKNILFMGAIASFLFMQSCEPAAPAPPAQVTFNAANVQGTWSVDKITDYDMSDNELSVTNAPDGFFDWNYGADDTLRIYVSGALNNQAHYQLGTHMGKNIIITTVGVMVDTVEVTSITASTMEFNNKIDVTATTMAGNEYEKYNMSR